MFGSLFVTKTVMLSMLLGSMLVFLQQNISSGSRPFFGNDAINRGLLFSVMIANPSAELSLFPIPIRFPAYALAAFFLGVDLWNSNTAAFGGVGSAYLMINYFI